MSPELLQLIAGLMLIACALFPPANFWVRFLIVLLSFAIHFIVIQHLRSNNIPSYSDYMDSKLRPSSNSYAENYPD